MTCEYLWEFSKKFEMVLMGYSWAGGKLNHEKNQKQKSCDTVHLKVVTNEKVGRSRRWQLIGIGLGPW